MQRRITLAWVLSTLFVVGGITCLSLGVVLNTWWINDTIEARVEKGLWRSCAYYDHRPRICVKRDPILNFEDGHEDVDSVLLVLIAAGTFGILAFITSSALFGCRRSHEGWNCGSVLLTLFTFISGASSLGALIFSMVQFEDRWLRDEYGLAFILSWVGCGMFFVAFLFASILICNSATIKSSKITRTAPRDLGNTSFDSVLTSNGLNCTVPVDNRRYTIYRKTSEDPDDENEIPSPPLRNVRRTKSLGTNVPIPSQIEYSALIRRACSNERLKRFIPTTKATNENVSRNYRDAFKKEFQNFKENHRELIAEELPSQTRYHETFNNMFQEKRTCFAVGRPLRKSRSSTTTSAPIEINEISAVDVHENFSPPLTSAERKSLGIEKFFPKGCDPRKVYKTENRQTTPIGFRGYKALSEGRASKYKKLFRPNRSCIDVRLFDSPDGGEEIGHIPAKRSKSTDSVFIESPDNNVRNKKHFSELIGEETSVFFYSRTGQHSKSVGSLDNLPLDITTDFYGTYSKDTSKPVANAGKSTSKTNKVKDKAKLKSKSEEDLSGEDYKESIRKIAKKYSIPQDSPPHLRTFQSTFEEKKNEELSSQTLPVSAHNGHASSTIDDDENMNASVTTTENVNSLNNVNDPDVATPQINSPESPTETQIFQHFILKTNDLKHHHPPPDVTTFDLLKETSVDDSDVEGTQEDSKDTTKEENAIEKVNEDTFNNSDLLLGEKGSLEEGSVERDVIENIIETVLSDENEEEQNTNVPKVHNENDVANTQTSTSTQDGSLIVEQSNIERSPAYIVVNNTVDDDIEKTKIKKRESYGDAARSFDIDDPVIFSDQIVSNGVVAKEEAVVMENKDGDNIVDNSTIDSKIYDKEKKKKKKGAHKSGDKVKRSSSREVLDDGERRSRSREKKKRSSSRDPLDDGDKRSRSREKKKRSSSKDALGDGERRSRSKEKKKRSSSRDPLDEGERKLRSKEKKKRSSSRDPLNDGENRSPSREKKKRSSSKDALGDGERRSRSTDKKKRSSSRDPLDNGEKRSRSTEKKKRSSSSDPLNDGEKRSRSKEKKRGGSESKVHGEKGETKEHHRSEEKIKRSSSKDVLDDAPRPLKKKTHRSGEEMKRSVSEDILDKPTDAPRHIKKRTHGKGDKDRKSSSKDILDEDTRSETLPDLSKRRKSGESSKSSRSSKSNPEKESHSNKRRKSGESAKSSKSDLLKSVKDISEESKATKVVQEKHVLEKSISAPTDDLDNQKPKAEDTTQEPVEELDMKRISSEDVLGESQSLPKEKTRKPEKSHRRHKTRNKDQSDEKDGESPRKRKHRHKNHDKHSKESSHRTKHTHTKSHRPKSISSLKTPLLLKIFSYLSTRDLCRVSQVCQKWNNLYLSPELWHSITITNYKGEDIDDIMEMLLERLKSAHAYTCINMQLIRLNHSVHLTDIGLINISNQCPGLKTLEITDCVEVTGQGLGAILAHCPNMSYLDLTGCEGLVDFDFSFGQHASFHELRYLDLSECYDLTDNALNLILNCATELEYLYLRLCDTITNTGIESVASYCPKLKEISLNDCPNVTDSSIKIIVTSCLNLRYISLAKCDIYDESLKHIKKYSLELRHLNLHECETITDEGIRILSEGCPNLRSLDISKCRKLTSASLLSLVNCQHLRRLNVKGCKKIVDTRLKEFATHSKVRHLNLTNCSVSPEMIGSMKRRMKHCKIVYSRSPP